MVQTNIASIDAEVDEIATRVRRAIEGDLVIDLFFGMSSVSRVWTAEHTSTAFVIVDRSDA